VVNQLFPVKLVNLQTKTLLWIQRKTEYGFDF